MLFCIKNLKKKRVHVLGWLFVFLKKIISLQQAWLFSYYLYTKNYYIYINYFSS